MTSRGAQAVCAAAHTAHPAVGGEHGMNDEGISRLTACSCGPATPNSGLTAPSCG
jgi:hypothetical protein